jgi:NADH-quinone oxidoreductase subunit N
VTVSDLVVLLPLIILAAGAVMLMLVIAFYRNHPLTFGLTLAGLAAAFISLLFISPALPRQVTPLLVVDSYAAFYIGLLLAASFAVALLAYGYLGRSNAQPEELYLLLLVATLGSAVLVTSSHFASFFLGLEILTVSLYTLIAYLRTQRSIEAGIKYLILAGVSSAFLLFGMALVYADLGTMELAQLSALLAQASGSPGLFLLTGLALMIIGIGFKLAVVPFHMWTPDIYQGASAPVTAFVATVSKGGMFALLLRYFAQMDVQTYRSLFVVFAAIAVASMFAGNLLALLQNNVKRILAYSSIAHLGYLLVAFLAGGAPSPGSGQAPSALPPSGVAGQSLGVTAASFYLAAYFATTIAAFGVVAVLRPAGGEREMEDMEDYRGLFWRRPWLAAIFTAALLSLAGIPLTAGFVGKFYILAAGIGSALSHRALGILWALAIILVINSAIGLYYYLRIVVIMGLQPLPAEERPSVTPAVPLAGGLALAAMLLALVWLGVYPTPLIRVIETMVDW